MFGFRPPDLPPAKTEATSAPVQSAPSSGLFLQKVPASECSSGRTPSSHSDSLQSEFIVPDRGQGRMQTKGTAFNVPQTRGGEGEGPTPMVLDTSKTLPAASAKMPQANPFLQPTTSFSFSSQSSNRSFFPFTGNSNVAADKPVSFSFLNPEKAVSSKMGFGDLHVPSNKSGPVSYAELETKGVAKPAFSFVKAKDGSVHSKTPNNPSKLEKPSEKDLQMDSKGAQRAERRDLKGKPRPLLPLKMSATRGMSERQSKSKAERSPAPDEISKITAIICKEVPDQFNTKQFIVEHFSRFGKVKSSRCYLKKKHAIVHFFDHATAKAAKMEGCSLGANGPKILIFWAAVSPKGRGQREKSSDVDEELMSMGGTAGEDLFEPRLLARPELPAAKDASTAFKLKGSLSDESLVLSLEKTALNFADRYAILDARDKLLRTKHQRQSDIRKATAVVGTCPDMCPEKERYSRTVKNGLSPFELLPTDMNVVPSCVMDPKAVVKEYSRSSADQEEPLSHELRPPAVLDLTMNYLVCNLMDAVECSAGEWFDFIWNRTRAIRKDITQQHLCDPLCVSLVEKCARFHIHCAAALAQEDISIFDPKINNENLTKCLQTLKHFYHDLAEKGVSCPNEAEFMAYDILLNLNEGDIIRQAQQFRDDVRESQAVRFGTELFFALNSNNYVRFFRLLQKASYLSACLLQRYFPQVRSKALSAICKAYRSQQFPFSDLVSLLCFEDRQEVEEYCEWLQLQTISGVGVLLRKSPTLSSSAPSVIRTSTLISSKRLVSVGEVVSGGPLPENPALWYEPHDSFDSLGKLQRSAFDALDQAEKVRQVGSGSTASEVSGLISSAPEAPVPAPAPPAGEKAVRVPSLVTAPPSVQPPRILPLVSPELHFFQAADDILCDLVLESVVEVAGQALADARLQFASSFANQTVATIVSDTVQLMSREISEDVCQEASLEKLNKEWADRLSRVSQEITNSLLDCLLPTDIRSVAEETLLEEKRALVSRTCLDLVELVLDEVVVEESSALASAVLWQEIKWAEDVQRFILKKLSHRVLKVFRRWHEICLKRRTVENVRKSFPCGPCLGVESAKRIKLDGLPIKSKAAQAKNISNLLLSDLYYHFVCEEMSGWPLDIQKLVGPILCERPSSASLEGFLLWKLVLYTPFSWQQDPCSNEPLAHSFSFGHRDTYHNIQDSLWASERRVGFVDCPRGKIGISTFHLSGRTEGTICGGILKGLSAVLSVLPLEDCYQPPGLAQVRQGLQSLLQSKSPLPSLPLALLVITDHRNTFPHDEFLGPSGLDVDLLTSTGLVSKAKVFCVTRDSTVVDFRHKLEEAVCWLAKNAPEMPGLISSYLEDFLEDSLNVLVFNQLFQGLAHKAELSAVQQSPAAILDLYNAALQFLANLASDRHLENYSWPGPEFTKFHPELLCADWNAPSKLEYLGTLIKSLMLKVPPVEKSSFESLQAVRGWLQALTVDVDPMTRSLFFCWVDQEFLKAEFVPWPSLLFSLFTLLLRNLKKDDKASLVRFDPKDLLHFKVPSSWFHFARETVSVAWGLEGRVPEEALLLADSPSKEGASDSEVLSGSTLSPGDCRRPVSAAAEEVQSMLMCQQLDQSLQEEATAARSYTDWLKAHSDLQTTNSSFTSPLVPDEAVPKEYSVSFNSLEDSLLLLQLTLRNERESARAFQQKLTFLQI